MASWRDHLNEIDADPGQSFPSYVKSAKSAKSRPDPMSTSDLTNDAPPFGAFDTFGNAYRTDRDPRAPESPTSALHPSPDPETATSARIRVLDEPDQLRKWRAGIARIDRDRPPKSYLLADWHRHLADAETFLPQWGAVAADLGWTTLDLFGVHATAPFVNYSAAGLVPMLRGSLVIAMTEASATMQKPAGNRLTFYRRETIAEAVPIWELAG
jgi:hypothetical protein